MSRAINRVPTVNPALAKRVWKVVDELGYYPNTQARALVSGRSCIFGLIISDITNPVLPEIVQAFETIAVQHHYEILLTSTVHDPKRMETSVRRQPPQASEQKIYEELYQLYRRVYFGFGKPGGANDYGDVLPKLIQIARTGP